MTPGVGDTFAGRYEINDHLGSGGFATVWQATDRQHGRDVALKCADHSTHDAGTVQARFEREISTLGRFEATITPAGVVRYLGGDTTTSPAYVVLEYLPGDPLSDALGTGRVGSSVRHRIVVDLAATLDFLHRNGVVYLDLRPENVVLRDSGRPVLIDFNTAVTVEETIETRFEADQFKPPELLPDANEEDPGPWSDVYAWGKLAFYLLTGAKVVPGDVPDDGLDPLGFGASCSPALAEVIQHATRPDPTTRHADGQSVLDAVARATGRGPPAVLTHTATGVTCPVLDGQRMGRLDEDTGVPWVVLPDPEQHVSPQHATFVGTADGWSVEDTSLNGTYVGGPDEWTLLISDRGFQVQQERGQIDADAAKPPVQRTVPASARIAPVHPSYGIELQLSASD